MIIEVHADIVMGCRIILYMYETRGSGGMLPQGKFEFLGKIMLHLRPFQTSQGQFSHSNRPSLYSNTMSACVYTCARVCVYACVCVFVHALIYYGVQEYTYL